MHLVVALHSHCPWVLHRDPGPSGSEALVRAVVDSYLPLLEQLQSLEVDDVAAPITLGLSPVLANQLAHPACGRLVESWLAERIVACRDAILAFRHTGEETFIPVAEFWLGRLGRLARLLDRLGGDLIGAFGRHAAAGRIELTTSAATHGLLPLLARDESIRLQLLVGRQEHERLFGSRPAGCWLPEWAYRPGGEVSGGLGNGSRPGLDELLSETGYRYFIADAHLAGAGDPLGLPAGSGEPAGPDEIEPSPPVQTPYRARGVGRGRRAVAVLIRDPRASGPVWSRHHGYAGDGHYLDVHEIRLPSGLRFWRGSGDAATRELYEPNAARARAFRHAQQFAELAREIAETEGPAEGEVIVAPFDTEVFGCWWFEGMDFLGDVYRALARRPLPRPVTASDHLARRPPSTAIELAAGSRRDRGDLGTWLQPGAMRTWQLLWSLEDRFWPDARRAVAQPECHRVLAQAARELLLAQSADWLPGTGGAADHIESRIRDHAAACERLLNGLVAGGPALARAADEAERLERVDLLFPDVLSAVAEAIATTPAGAAVGS